MFRKKNTLKLLAYTGAVATCFCAGQALAVNIGGIADTITGSFSSIGKLMIATAYIAGMGFSVAAVFKFKQHRDNPTQIPVGTPIALLAIGVVLIFLPGIIAPVGETMFGNSSTNAAGGFTGGGATGIPGGDATK